MKSMHTKANSIQNEYIHLKNAAVDPTVSESYLISSINKEVEMICLASCNSNSKCLTVAYSSEKKFINNCYLFNQTFIASDMVKTTNVTTYVKISGKQMFNLQKKKT